MLFHVLCNMALRITVSYNFNLRSGNTISLLFPFKIIQNLHNLYLWRRVVGRLIRRKAWLRISGQISKRNIKQKIFPLSRFLAKTLRVNKTCHEMLFKRKRLCSSESTLNCRSRRSLIKLTHTTWVLWEAWPVILTEGLQWPIL